MSGGTVIFAGGGTGGHIFPAVAIAEELAALSPGTACEWLISSRALDARILDGLTVRGQRAKYRVLAAQPFGLAPGVLARFVRNWGAGVRGARGAIAEARGRGAVVMVAMGGFVAAPAAQGARAEKCPLLLVNLDAVPGRANRWIARRARGAVTTAPVVGVGATWERVAPIVRRGAVAAKSREECVRELGLDPAKRTLLVTGGSQGAASMNDLLAAMVADVGLRAAFEGWQVLHQTGAGRGGVLGEAYAAAGVLAVVRDFVQEMGAWWGAADLAVARAGAGNVGEVWACRVPTVFLPYPYHADEHQRLNAAPLAEVGGAVVLKDWVDAGRNLGEVGKRVAALMRDEGERGRMRAALAGLGPADGAARIAAKILEVLRARE